jgi:hypothetical protein
MNGGHEPPSSLGFGFQGGFRLVQTRITTLTMVSG